MNLIKNELMNPFFCHGIAQLIAGLVGGSAWTLFLTRLIQDNTLDIIPGTSLDEVGAFALLIGLSWWIIKYFRDRARKLEKLLNSAHERECVALQDEIQTLKEVINSLTEKLTRE